MFLDQVLTSLSIDVDPFTLCLLSEGWRLRLPRPPSVMLHFVLQGTGAVLAGRGEAHPIAPYWLAVVPRGEPHALQTSGPVQRERHIEAPPPGARVPPLIAGSSTDARLQVACGLVRVAYGESLGLFDHLHEVLAVDLSDAPQVRSSFQGILAEQTLPGPGSEAMQKALMSQCLVHLFRALCRDSSHPLPWLTAIEDARLGAVIDRLLRDPAAHYTVDSLAETAAMSRSAFMERFVTAFGRPPMTFLHNVRMQRAARLLRTDTRLSLDEIAERVGYASRSHFSQAFTRHYGMRPTVFRLEH